MKVTDASQVKGGDEVVVTYRAKVSEKYYPSSSTIGICVEMIGNGKQLRLVYPDIDNVELVEPVYVYGGIYLDADGAVWMYERTSGSWGAWSTPGSTVLSAFDVPARPLVRMLPEKSS